MTLILAGILAVLVIALVVLLYHGYLLKHISAQLANLHNVLLLHVHVQKPDDWRGRVPSDVAASISPVPMPEG